MSKIEWTDVTWNPVTGCTKISAGCKHCYAERMAKRLQAMGQRKYKNGFEVTTHPEELGKPGKWRKPRMVFVCSMGDLFHNDVPGSFIQSVFNVMLKYPNHRYQILTKRPDRLALVPSHWWAGDMFAGVTIEHPHEYWRINYLRRCHAHHKFLSLEPLLGPLPNLDLTDIHWVIVGGESGPGARPMHPDWVRDIRDQCVAQNVPFFFKQWGGVNKKQAGRLLDGKVWDQMPTM
jgi:protein gp37